jgi:uncharacterized RDD family membrane protein YckC
VIVQVPVFFGGVLIGLDGAARASLAAAADAAYNGILDGSASGQTIGKRIMDIKVVGELDRLPIGVQRGLQRAIIPAIAAAGGRSGWAVAAIASVLGFVDAISPLFDGERRRSFHDRLAGSMVVDADD